MVTVYKQRTWKIAVYGGEPHGLPHFHVEGRGYRSSIVIATGEEIAGKSPSAVLAEARAWAAANQQLLLDKYEELNS